MTNATEAIRKIQESARATAAGARITEIIGAIAAPGAYVRQGDVLLTFCKPGKEKRGERVSERQLAPGSTQGSRHIAEGDVAIYAPATPSPLIGPLLVVGEGGCTITHPEHRHYRLPAGSEVRVTYERDLGAEEIARVQD